MAGGNLGDLWFQLGIRQNVSQQLDKVLSSLGLTDKEANKLLHTLQGLGNRELGISKQSAKNADTFADVLNKINKKYVELSKNEDTKDGAKVLLDRTKNALNYLAALQRIAGAQHSLENLKSLNPNVDTSKLKEASGWLEALKKQMLNLQSYGGVDNAKVIGFYSQAVSATLRDVAKVTSSFKKENPLSVLSGNTAKVETDLSRVTEKFAKLNDLMAEGARKGYNTSMLTSSFAELNSVLARLQSAQGNNSLLSDAAQMKNLFSDVQVAVNKAGDAMSAYGREKGKVIAAEKEHQAELSKAEKKANEKAAADRKLTLGLAEMEAWLKRIDALGMKGLNLGADVSKMDEIRAKVQALADTFLSFSGANINTPGKGGRDSLDDLINKLRVLRTEYSEARQAQRELNSEQSRVNNKAAAEQKRQEAEARRDNARAAREEAADEKAVASAIESARKRYQELSEVIRQLKAERKTASNLGLDTAQLDAAIERAMSGVRSLRDLLQNLQNTKSFDLVARASFGNGSDIAGATNNAIRGYKELNNEKRHANELEQKHRQEVIATAAKVRNDLAQAFRQANQHAGQMNGTLQDLKNLFLQGGLVYGAQQFVMSIIQTGGEMEKQHIALQSILGDIQNANTMFGQIKQLALESPFTFSELNKDVKQLAAYGVEYEDLYDTTKRLADMSSGLGVSFERIALAFGQVQARGWLDGKELRQIAYAGIPLLSKLSEMYSKREGKTVTTSEIKKRISNREVSFDDVKSIFWEMTDAGGQFYNMQQVLSETLLGRYNKLKDAWEIMLSEFASGESIVGGTFSFIIDRITDVVLAANKLGGTFTALFTSFALLKGMKALGGGAGAAFLASKGQAANAAMGKLAQGQALTSVERQILATKNQITNADLRSLIASKSITEVELQRLLVSDKISAKQYQTYAALLKRQGATTALTAKTVAYGLSWTRVGMAAKLAFGGIVTAAKGLWAAIGGLPGLILTGVVSAVAYIVGNISEMSAAIQRSTQELQDRFVGIGDFIKENNITDAIATHNTKEIDNLISAYKDKIKEVAAYDYDVLSLKADEIKGHEERLRFLQKELDLIRLGNEEAARRLQGRGLYSKLNDNIEDASDASKSFSSKYQEALADRGTNETDLKNAIQWNISNITDSEALNAAKAAYSDVLKKAAAGADWEGAKEEFYKSLKRSFPEKGDREINNAVSNIFSGPGEGVGGGFWHRYFRNISEGYKDVKEEAEDFAKTVKKLYPDIADNKVHQESAKSMLETFMAGQEMSSSQMLGIRQAVYNALGLGDPIESEIATKLNEKISAAMPTVAEKIRMEGVNSLSPAVQDQIKTLMQAAGDEVIANTPLAAERVRDIIGSIELSDTVRNKVMEAMEAARGASDDEWPSIESNIRSLLSGTNLSPEAVQKVVELINSARNALPGEYRGFSNQLQSLLNNSYFSAIIHLIPQVAGDPAGDNEKQIYNNLRTAHGNTLLNDDKFYNQVWKPYQAQSGGAGDLSYSERNDATSKAYNEQLKSRNAIKEAVKAGKATQAQLDKENKKLENIRNLSLQATGYDPALDAKYTGSNAHNRPKKNKKTGNKKKAEDTALKTARANLSAMKAFYQEYKKYKEVVGPDRALKEVEALYPDVSGMDVKDYYGSLQKMLDNYGEGWFSASPERKKFKTEIQKMMADWKLDEEFKKEAELAMSAFNKTLEDNISQFDLYRSLKEKTGSESFASKAFYGHYADNNLTRSLKKQFWSVAGESFNPNMTDKEAEYRYEDNKKAYELWKKITELVKNEYVKNLNEAAELISNTRTDIDKINSIRGSYKQKRENLKANGNDYLIPTLNRQEKEELSGTILNIMKRNWGWDANMKAAETMSVKELRELRKSLAKLIADGVNKGLSNESMQQLYDGYDKLGSMLSESTSGAAAKEMTTSLWREEGALTAAKSMYAIFSRISPNSKYTQSLLDAVNEQTKRVVEIKQQVAKQKENRENARLGNATTIGNIFSSLGGSDGSGKTTLSNIGGWYTSIADMFADGSTEEGQAKMAKNSKVGSFIGMFAGLAEVISEKGFDKFLEDAVNDSSKATGSVIDSFFGTHLSKSEATKNYEDAKEKYENLIDTWDKLISRKEEYLNEKWGDEATKAGEEAIALIDTEVEATRVLARKRAGAGASVGSHSYGYRSWYKNRDEQGHLFSEYADEISAGTGASIKGVGDLTELNAEQLKWVQETYPVFWAQMDGKFREYLEKIIELGDQAEDIADSVREKLTGWTFDNLVEAWASTMATMANYSDSLVDNFEENFKNAILNAMVYYAYGDKIEALMKKTEEYGKNNEKFYDSAGNVLSKYTESEYADIMGDADELAKDVENGREILRKAYGWTDDSSSSSSKSIKSITEETADLLASYLNAIRADVSVIRAEQAVLLPELSTIAKSQLTQLTSISANTLRNADAAERMEVCVMEMRDNMKSVINGTKKLHVY